MHLVIGGAYQGKLDYVIDKFPERKGQIYEGDKLAECCIRGREEWKGSIGIIHSFHLFVKTLLEKEIEPYEIIESIILQNPEVIIICNELGCGLVPIEAADRVYREKVGRILCRLAEHAESVERVYCGIGERLK